MAKPLVGIIMGSTSDWETMQHCTQTLDQLGVSYEKRVISAHLGGLYEHSGRLGGSDAQPMHHGADQQGTQEEACRQAQRLAYGRPDGGAGGQDGCVEAAQ